MPAIYSPSDSIDHFLSNIDQLALSDLNSKEPASPDLEYPGEVGVASSLDEEYLAAWGAAVEEH